MNGFWPGLRTRNNGLARGVCHNEILREEIDAAGADILANGTGRLQRE